MEIQFNKNNYQIQLNSKELLLLKSTLEELIPSSSNFESHVLINEFLLKCDDCIYENLKENLK